MGIKELQLYGSGGTEAVDGIKGLNYVEQARLRAINPFISLFGAGLSDMDGKLAICDLTPNIQMSAEEMKKMRFIGMTYGVRFDDTGRQSVLSPLISVDEIAAYMKKLEEKRKNDKALYKLEDEVKKLQELDNEDKLSEKQKEELFEKEVKLEEDRKKKGLSYQQVFKAEHINPGIELFSSIAPRAGHTFTELEKSMLLHGLFTLSQQSIGSWGRVGYGRLAWHIKNEDGQTLFKSTPDPRYTFTCHVEWTKEGEEMRRPFDQWLENIKREDLVF